MVYAYCPQCWGLFNLRAYIAGKENAYMNNIETTNNSTTSDNTPQQMTEKLGNTTYEVFIHFSQTSKETLMDKVMRLIRNELGATDM